MQENQNINIQIAQQQPARDELVSDTISTPVALSVQAPEVESKRKGFLSILKDVFSLAFPATISGLSLTSCLKASKAIKNISQLSNDITFQELDSLCDNPNKISTYDDLKNECKKDLSDIVNLTCHQVIEETEDGIKQVVCKTYLDTDEVKTAGDYLCIDAAAKYENDFKIHAQNYKETCLTTTKKMAETMVERNNKLTKLEILFDSIILGVATAALVYNATKLTIECCKERKQKQQNIQNAIAEVNNQIDRNNTIL